MIGILCIICQYSFSSPFTFNKIREYNENQNAAIKQAQSGKPNSSTLVDSEGNVNKDQFKKLTNETLMNRNRS